MVNQNPSSKPKRRRRDRGDDGIWWDKANRCYVGAISLGTKSGGKRNRPSVRGKTKGYIRVVKASKGRYGATHAATETGELACGTKPHKNAAITEVSREPKEATCRSCRSHLGIDETDNANLRLEALFVLSITLGLRPGELRKLTWAHVDLNRGVVHVWRSASKTGDTKTPKSKRSLTLPKRAITALKAHKDRQDRERQNAGEAWRDHGLVFCHENGDAYTSDALNWRFSKMTARRASATGTPTRVATPQCRS